MTFAGPFRSPKIALYVVTGITLSSILGLFAVILVQDGAIVKMKRQLAQDQASADLTRVALNQPIFLSTLSPKDALVWTLLAKEGKETSTKILFEYRDEASFKSVPIVVQFNNGTFNQYVVVVGVRIYSKTGGETGYVVPALGYYVDGGDGLSYLHRFTDDIGEMIRDHREGRGQKDWSAFKTNLERQILQHVAVRQTS